jgi:tripartite-type tricarboxylate transporter receptor subunit TctC
VPYKGSGPSIVDLMAGQVQYTFDTPAATWTQVKAGKLKAIAVTTTARLPSAPNVPTMGEAGLPGFVGGTWFGLLAPAKTPRPVIDRLNAEVAAVLHSPQFRKVFEERDIIPGGDSPEEFGRFIAAEVTKWRTLAARIGLQPQ